MLLLAVSCCATLPILAAPPTATPARSSLAGELPSQPESVPAEVSLIAAGIQLASSKPAAATGDKKLSADAPSTPSQNVTINLINRLVQRGVLAKEDAADLIKQAEADAVAARAQSEADAGAAAQAAVSQATNQIVAANALQNTAPPADADAVRVTYVPEIVKAQLRDEVKADLVAEMKNEGGIPGLKPAVPSWVSRFRFTGDVRVRYEGDFFPRGNDNSGAFPNFTAINSGAPFDVSGTQFSPQQNVDQDRNRFRLRARIGVEVDLTQNFTAGLRIATGETNSPVSENQTFGLANNGQGGNFSKYAIYLDRAFLKYEVGAKPERDFSFTIGRFDNPFFATTILWADDLAFDGAVAQARYQVARGVTPFLTAGAFPVFNTDFNFSTNQPAKFKSEDRYLYGGQLGVDWRLNKDFNLKVAGAYYYFDNVEGRLSDPFTPLSASDQGNTDASRTPFAQKGNTFFPIRRIRANALNNFGTTNQFQYFGLATPFHEAAFTGKLDYNHFEPFQISLIGEYVKNVAFDRGLVESRAINNRGPNTSGINGLGAFEGGDNAWIVNLRGGHAALEKLWDYQVGINYRYVESDAVVDAFNDSDFGLGGTNLKGYTLYGSLALGPRVWLGLRYFSATQIAGPPFKSDIVQFDINGKF